MPVTTTTITHNQSQAQQQQQQPAAGQHVHALSERPVEGGEDGNPTANQQEERVVLRLRPRKKKGVKWTEETVDNEGLGRKSSKKCCIFHKQKVWGDWSDEDKSSDCESDGASDIDDKHKDGKHCGEQKERDKNRPLLFTAETKNE